MCDIYSTLQTTVDELADKLDNPGLDVEMKKILEKLEEARYNRGDISVWADCILAILMIVKHEGFSVEDTFKSLQAVAQEMQNRDWKKMPDGTHRVM